MHICFRPKKQAKISDKYIITVMKIVTLLALDTITFRAESVCVSGVLQMPTVLTVFWTHESSSVFLSYPSPLSFWSLLVIITAVD